jgi:hypothetical protein
MIQEEAKPHKFCETPNEKCTMNYCDENGCLNRKRELVKQHKEYKIGTFILVGAFCLWALLCKIFLG